MVYVCQNCGKELDEVNQFITCVNCGGRILIKKRSSLAREVSTD